VKVRLTEGARCLKAYIVTELSSKAQKIIREEHPNAQPYCDGDIYRYIRMNQRLGDMDAELKWRGRLSEDSAKGLLRLEKDFRRVQGALDRLLPFIGLWEPLKLSYLGEWMSVKCPEVCRLLSE
jgi:hypothetical protein